METKSAPRIFSEDWFTDKIWGDERKTPVPKTRRDRLHVMLQRQDKPCKSQTPRDAAKDPQCGAICKSGKRCKNRGKYIQELDNYMSTFIQARKGHLTFDKLPVWMRRAVQKAVQNPKKGGPKPECCKYCSIHAKMIMKNVTAAWKRGEQTGELRRMGDEFVQSYGPTHLEKMTSFPGFEGVPKELTAPMIHELDVFNVRKLSERKPRKRPQNFLLEPHKRRDVRRGAYEIHTEPLRPEHIEAPWHRSTAAPDSFI